jgi:hypothetical protein
LFFYEFKEDVNVYYGYSPIMSTISEKKNADNFKVRFSVKEGEFEVYKILDWDIVSR